MHTRIPVGGSRALARRRRFAGENSFWTLRLLIGARAAAANAFADPSVP
jgi:hypothetical protein